MSRKIRMSDVADAASWVYGVDLHTNGTKRATRQSIHARRCAYIVCRELGFTWQAIADEYDRHFTTVIASVKQGPMVDPDDLAAVLANARARALADSEVLS